MPSFYHWLYRGGRPNLFARAMNRGWAIIHSLGFAPNYLVTLEVKGRKTGKKISFPLVMTVVDGERYLVSMLGDKTTWVRNIRASDGYATLRHGTTEQVRLVEVKGPCGNIMKAYLKRAPGARPHIGIDLDAPPEAFDVLEGKVPVFRVVTINGQALTNSPE